MTDQMKDFLKVVGNVLFYCWIFGFVLLFIGFGVAQMMAQAVYEIHGAMFGLSSHEINVVFYCWLGLTKLHVLTLFFIPWLAIKMVLNEQDGPHETT